MFMRAWAPMIDIANKKLYNSSVGVKPPEKKPKPPVVAAFLCQRRNGMESSEEDEVFLRPEDDDEISETVSLGDLLHDLGDGNFMRMPAPVE